MCIKPVHIVCILLVYFKYTSAQLPSIGLVAYYPFDNHVNDESKYGNHGTVIGNVVRTTDRYGNSCGAMQFDGTTGYVSVPSSNSINQMNGLVSIAAWVKLDRQGALQDKWVTLLCKGNIPAETPMNPHFRFQLFQGASQSTVSINTDFTEYDNAYQQHKVDFDRWHFYVMIYDGANVWLYMDGAPVFQYPYTGFLNSNNMPLEIGRDVPGSMEYLAGCIDDLRIYNRVLTATEIGLLYNDKSGKLYADDFVLEMPKNVEVASDAGKCGAAVNYSLPKVSTSCGAYTLTRIKGGAPNSYFNVGTAHVKYLAINGDRQQAVNFYIDVKDKEPPQITCPKDILYTCNTGETQAKIVYDKPVVSDNCTGAKYMLDKGLNTGSYFPIGKNAVSYKGYDAMGNTSTCMFTVTVLPAKVEKVMAAIDTPKTKKVEKEVIGKPADEPIKGVAVKKVDSVRYSNDIVHVNDCLVTILIYDGGTEDNDTISAFFNGKMIADYVMLHNRMANRLDNIIKATIKLEPGQENYLVCKAWNTGKTWPNTATMDIYTGVINSEKDMAGKKAIRKVVEAVPGIDGGIKFICR